ncbi:thioredoxin family protein [Sulfurovum sp. NBC37-1]|uniref:thioredoxin family protein n=1 Tax=Sulfurovum sp. (strain NBC37-1) TaxID=387093 RepID=UPI0001587596|nr:thioredoxin family protein [Sulfurovum sp. NBC37-1]BAF71210.1 conserved hypothetical protein [Sulfurovum sp. NBC37-1]
MHKQPLKLLWLWLFPLIVSANFIHWMGDYDTAHQKALKEHKPLLVLVVKQNSALSGKIIQTAFMNKPYVDMINEKMVSVIVTYEGSKSYPVEMYYTTVFPTLFFVDSGKEIVLGEPLYGEKIAPVLLEKIIGYATTHH